MNNYEERKRIECEICGGGEAHAPSCQYYPEWATEEIRRLRAELEQAKAVLCGWDYNCLKADPDADQPCGECVSCKLAKAQTELERAREMHRAASNLKLRAEAERDKAKAELEQAKAHARQIDDGLASCIQDLGVERELHAQTKAELASWMEAAAKKDEALTRAIQDGYEYTRHSILFAEPEWVKHARLMISLQPGSNRFKELEAALYDANSQRVHNGQRAIKAESERDDLSIALERGSSEDEAYANSEYDKREKELEELKPKADGGEGRE